MGPYDHPTAGGFIIGPGPEGGFLYTIQAIMTIGKHFANGLFVSRNMV